MYHPTTRVLAVLALLQSHGRLTGADMARRLEVNIRTLRRYITMLQDLGIPIVAERGRNGSYELVPGYQLPPMMFTNEEALALSVGLMTAHRLGLADIVQAIVSAQAKLELVMPLELKAQIQALSETATLDSTAQVARSATNILLTISSATHQQRRVHLHYRSRADDITERNFDPYGLTFQQGFWYTIGYCGLRRDLRSFRLDRILQAEITEEQFERPSDFDALVYLRQSVALLPRQFTFEVLLKTDLATAQQAIFVMLGVLQPHSEGVMLRGTTDDLDWLARTLAQFSFPFAIASPPELREALRRHGERLVFTSASAP